MPNQRGSLDATSRRSAIPRRFVADIATDYTRNANIFKYGLVEGSFGVLVSKV